MSGVSRQLAPRDLLGRSGYKATPDRNAEARVQAAVVEWCRIAVPGVVIFAIPNGGLRGKAEAARLKWTGVLAGVPDLCVIAPSGRAYFLEVKADGALSSAQRELRKILTGLSAPVAVARSIDDARSAFMAWGIKTREARL